MLLISLCYISRLIFGVLAFYAIFTPLYFIAAALLALSLWFKWDKVRLFQIIVWVIVYATAGTTTALVIVLIDIGISYFRRSSVVKPQDPQEELQDPEIPQIPEIDIETVPVFVQPVQSEEGNTTTPA